MSVWRRYVSLSGRRRAILTTTTILLIATQVALHLFGYKRTYRLLMSMIRWCPVPSGVAIGDVQWAIGASARRVLPEGSCLVQALVTQAVLWRLGHRSTLCIGVHREPHAPLVAHAWVTFDQAIVVGMHPQLDRYHVLFCRIAGQPT